MQDVCNTSKNQLMKKDIWVTKIKRPIEDKIIKKYLKKGGE